MNILLTTFGSLGDLHPYIALGLALKQRGHVVGIATSPNYRSKIESEGLNFYPVRPDFEQFGHPSEWMHKAMDTKGGPEYVIKHLVLPHLTDSYVDIKRAAIGQDVIISHPLSYAVPIVADKLDMPWISVMLQPLTFFSIYEFPVLPGQPLLQLFRNAGPKFNQWLLEKMKERTISWMDPIQKLRTEVGLEKTTLHPMFEGQFSPTLNLALFSPEFGQAQQDAPKNTVISGFVFYDKMEANQQLSNEICDFLDEGPAPIVFTLGSSAVNSPGQFYTEAIKAAKKLGTRAILLTGKEGSRDIEKSLPEGIRAFDYAPYSLLFPRAAAIVHQGGVGTTAQALRAGKPQIIVPFSHDQPDNAARITKMGVGLSIELGSFNGNSASAKLKKLLQSGNYVGKAAEVGKLIRAENGEQKACETIESALNMKEEATRSSLAGQPL